MKLLTVLLVVLAAALGKCDNLSKKNMWCEDGMFNPSKHEKIMSFHGPERWCFYTPEKSAFPYTELYKHKNKDFDGMWHEVNGSLPAKMASFSIDAMSVRNNHIVVCAGYDRVRTSNRFSMFLDSPTQFFRSISVFPVQGCGSIFPKPSKGAPSPFGLSCIWNSEESSYVCAATNLGMTTSMHATVIRGTFGLARELCTGSITARSKEICNTELDIVVVAMLPGLATSILSFVSLMSGSIVFFVFASVKILLFFNPKRPAYKVQNVFVGRRLLDDAEDEDEDAEDPETLKKDS